MKKYFSIFILFLFIISCNNEQKLQIVIAGKVLSQKVNEVKLVLYDNKVSMMPKEYIAKVLSDSTFIFDIPSDRSLSGRISIGRFFHKIYLIPGDDLKLEIFESNIKYSGKGAERNNFLYEVVEREDFMVYFPIASMSSDVSEVSKLVKEKIDSFVSARDLYAKTHYLEDEFINNITIDVNSAMESFLIIYPNMFRKKNEELTTEFKSIKSVKNFIDDSKLGSSLYFSNMHNFIFQKVHSWYNNPNYSFDSLIQVVLFDSITGKSKDYAIARYLKYGFKRNKFHEEIYNRFESEIKDSLAQEIVENEYDRFIKKQKLLDEPIDDKFITTILEDDQGHNISFGEMVKRYEGKLLYIELWNLGCAPCRASMPNSKKFKEKFKNRPIEFIYITTDRFSKNLWEKVYKISLTEDNHYRFINGFDAKLLEYLGINWVPNYILIDKDSKLLSFQAVRPTDPKFESEIMKYIN